MSENLEQEFWGRKKDPKPPRHQQRTPKERLAAGGAGLLVASLIAAGGYIKSSMDGDGATSARTTSTSAPASTAPPSKSYPTGPALPIPEAGPQQSLVFDPSHWETLRAFGWSCYGNRSVDTQQELDALNAELGMLKQQYGDQNVQVGPIYDEQNQTPMSGQEAAEYYTAHPGSPHLEGIYIWEGYPA